MLFGNSKTPQEESRDMFHLERTGTNIMKARKNGLSDIVSLAPFLSGGVLSQIAGELLRTGKLTDIPPCCPCWTASSSKPIWKTNTDPSLSRSGGRGTAPAVDAEACLCSRVRPCVPPFPLGRTHSEQKESCPMTILVTAFEPFQGETVNATMEALALLPDAIGGHTLVKRILPVVFGQAIREIGTLVDQLQPGAVICLGQSTGRADITPERVAINLSDARIPDNAGNQPRDLPIRPGGPAAYFSTLPVREMTEAMRAAGVPASLSNTAGTFVCNHLMYGLLDHLSRTGRNIPAGFIHLPATPAQAAERPSPSMSPETAAKGLAAAINALILK